MRGDNLDRDATTLFALEKYRALKRLDGRPFYYHPRKVAKIAEMLLTKHIKAKADTIAWIPPEDTQKIEESWHAGWLHDSMEDGDATFDCVAHVTNIRVAQWVAALTQDNRLPGPRRVREYTINLASQCEEVKIIKLADLGNNLDDAVAFLKRKPLESKKFLGHWPDEIFRTLEAIERIRTVALADEFGWCLKAAEALAKCAKRPSSTAEILDGLPQCPIKAPKKKRRRRRRSR